MTSRKSMHSPLSGPSKAGGGVAFQQSAGFRAWGCESGSGCITYCCLFRRPAAPSKAKESSRPRRIWGIACTRGKADEEGTVHAALLKPELRYSSAMVTNFVVLIVVRTVAATEATAGTTFVEAIDICG